MLPLRPPRPRSRSRQAGCAPSQPLFPCANPARFLANRPQNLTPPRHARRGLAQGVKLLALYTVPTGASVFLTAIGPSSTPAGTLTLSFFAEAEVTVAARPSKLTVEWLLKPTPLIVTSLPATLLAGLKLVTESVGVNVA